MTAPNLLSDLVPVNNTQTIGTAWSPFKEGYFNKIIVSSGAGTNYDYDGSANYTSMDLTEEEITGAPAPSPWTSPENFYISGGSPGYWNRTDAGNRPGGHLGIRSGRNSYIEKADGTFAETASKPGIGFYVSKSGNDHPGATGKAEIKYYGYDEIAVMDNNSIRVDRPLIPYTDGKTSIGDASHSFKEAYVKNVKGNADSATKATNDSANQQIDTTYIKGLSVDGKTITYTKGDDSTSTITTQDTTYTVASGDNNGEIKITPSSGSAYNVSVKGLGSRAYDSTDYLPLRGGTVTGVTAFTNTTASSSISTGAVTISGGLGVAGNIYGNKVWGAVFNDLADSIPVDEDCNLEPGYCYCFDGKKYTKSSKYLDEGIIGIHSDTFGFKMGNEEGKKKMDVAVSGFVLAYVDKEYKPGTPLTCTKNGYLTEIRKEDKIEYPEKIVATYWKNEPTEEWGPEGKKIKVKGRRWVKIK